MSRINVTSNSWTCVRCNLYNDILTLHCKDCNSHRPEIFEQLAIIVQYKRAPTYLGGNNPVPNDPDMIELHTQFFNHEAFFVKDLNDTELRLHRDSLAKVILEGRARMNAVDREERERKAKLSPDGKSWLVSSENSIGTDTLNLPKERQKRMSKADKLLDAMKSLGIANADDLIKNVERSSTTQQVNNITFNSTKEKALVTSEFCRIEQHTECPGSFHSDGSSKACHCECHKVTKSVQETTPFNPGKLFGA